jgi:hypothetical protein
VWAFSADGGVAGTIQVFDRDEMFGKSAISGGDDFDFNRQEEAPEGLAAAIAPFMLGQQRFGAAVLQE